MVTSTCVHVLCIVNCMVFSYSKLVFLLPLIILCNSSSVDVGSGVDRQSSSSEDNSFLWEPSHSCLLHSWLQKQKRHSYYAPYAWCGHCGRLHWDSVFSLPSSCLLEITSGKGATIKAPLSTSFWPLFPSCWSENCIGQFSNVSHSWGEKISNSVLTFCA